MQAVVAPVMKNEKYFFVSCALIIILSLMWVDVMSIVALANVLAFVVQ